MKLGQSFLNGVRFSILGGHNFVGDFVSLKNMLCIHSGHSKSPSCEYTSAETDNKVQVRI